MFIKNNKGLLAIALMVSLYSGSSFASIGTCDPNVGQALAISSLDKLQIDKKNINQLNQNDLALLDQTDDAYSCSDVWQNANVSVSFQKVQDLIKEAGKQLISKACNAAEEKIQEATSKAAESVSLDTSNIPGLSNLNLGTLASVSTGTSSSGTSSITVNGSSTTLGSVLK